MDTVLVVEDSRAMQRTLQRLLEADFLNVQIASDGISGLELFRKQLPSAVLLDLKLPGLSGKELCREFKSIAASVPIVVLSANAEVEDKVLLLELGADDYVTKPFGVDELLARIRAAQRHRLQQEGEKPVFHAGDLSVDLVRRIVTARGNEVKLSPREYEVLRLMVAHAGKVLTHRFMLREIWGNDSDVQYLRIYVRSLRQKIEADAERPSHILTETGVGYRLREPD